MQVAIDTCVEYLLTTNVGDNENIFLSFLSGKENSAEPHIVYVWKSKDNLYQICVNPEDDHMGSGHYVSKKKKLFDLEYSKSFIKGALQEVCAGYTGWDGTGNYKLIYNRSNNWTLYSTETLRL